MIGLVSLYVAHSLAARTHSLLPGLCLTAPGQARQTRATPSHPAACRLNSSQTNGLQGELSGDGVNQPA
jgi:hypothetical protein